MDEIKSKILKFINSPKKINAIVEHLENIPIEETFKILVDMVRNDKSISAGGQLLEDNMLNIIWLPKTK